MSDKLTKTPEVLTAKRTIKDSVFGDLFSDKKYLLMLYQALHPEDKTATVDDLNYVTLENVLVNDLYNDLGMLVGDKLMILVEAQSTWSPNIAVRGFLYLAKTYQDYLTATHQKGDLYSEKKVKLPKPELYVLYTGGRRMEKKSISLSKDFFCEEEVALDVNVKLLTDGVQGDIISQYVAFTKVIDEQVKLCGRTEKAIRSAIQICKERDILKEYLISREKEVINIMIQLYSQEEVYLDHVASERRDAAEQATKKARQEAEQKSRETAQRLYKMGLPIDKICEALGHDKETVTEWTKDLRKAEEGDAR